MPLILGTNSIKDTGYNVANSARWNRADGAYMDRTFSSAGNRDKWTYSLWVKKCKNGLEQRLLTTSDNATFDDNIRFNSDDTLTVICNNTTVLKTNRKFRDPSSWYHICVIWDSGNSTSGDRCKLFVNGIRETSFSTESYPSQNQDSFINNNTRHYIGVTNVTANSHFLDGYLTEVVFQNDSADSPVDKFGEFDSDTPTIFKPINVSGLTFGTNGFYLDFEDSSALGNDVSGNNNDFSLTNFAATDQNTDTCTNNACTWNTLYRNSATFTQGNLVYQAPSSNPVFGSITTFGVSAGKWYAECKYVAGSNHYGIIGICDEVFATLGDLGSATNTDFGKTGSALGSHPNDCTVAYVINTGAIRNNNNNQSYGSGGGDGDIINIALDRDNRKVYFGINGTYENSGNPGSGSNGFDLSSQVTGNFYFLGVTNDTGASETILDFNFGGGFGQTTVSSGNSDANGHGNFEHAVPTGFFSWNTKNLAENG